MGCGLLAALVVSSGLTVCLFNQDAEGNIRYTHLSCFVGWGLPGSGLGISAARYRSIGGVRGLVLGQAGLVGLMDGVLALRHQEVGGLWPVLDMSKWSWMGREFALTMGPNTSAEPIYLVQRRL